MRHDLEAEYVQYVRGCLTRLHRLAYMLCGDAHRADDVVQETLTAVYARWPTLRSVANIDAYVRTMLVRSFLQERRRPWSRVRLGAAVPETATAGGSGVEDRDEVMRALGQVPARPGRTSWPSPPTAASSSATPCSPTRGGWHSSGGAEPRYASPLATGGRVRCG
jgi:DNA-directed RNA polymerase specialized sigma24 family protein